MFTYGGCEGNKNNFETKEDCKHECVKENVLPRVGNPYEGGKSVACVIFWIFGWKPKACQIYIPPQRRGEEIIGNDNGPVGREWRNEENFYD